MRFNRRRVIVWGMVLFFLLGVAVLLARDYWSWEGEIPIADGTTIHVEQNGSEWKYFGHPHVFGFGGGDPRSSLRFGRKGSYYTWKGAFIPILVDYDGSTPILLVFDRETDFFRIAFRYYRHEKVWKEVPLNLFPRHMAIQNLWLRRSDYEDEFETVRTRDPSSHYFQRSLTAALWFCLANNVQYWEASVSTSITPEFLAEYEKKYILRKN